MKAAIEKVLTGVLTAACIAILFWTIRLEVRLTKIEIQLQIIGETVGTINILKDIK